MCYSKSRHKLSKETYESESVKSFHENKVNSLTYVSSADSKLEYYTLLILFLPNKHSAWTQAMIGYSQLHM